MGQLEIDNHTSFAVESLILHDEDGRPLLVPLIQASYQWARAGGLTLAEQQPKINLCGERWEKPWPDDADAAATTQPASYKHEPHYAFTKPATDVVLVGHAHAHSPRSTSVDVVFSAGPLRKHVRVFGERTWVRRRDRIVATDPSPFERIPLCYERAFGGWDRSGSMPSQHRCEPRNPVGVGFRAAGAAFTPGVRLPNLEDPQHLLTHYGDIAPPAGFGWVAPNWQPRSALGGTFDDRWQRERMPLLPRDFDRRFFNAASPGLVASGYFAGDERIVVVNATAAGRVSFRLPGRTSPVCRVVRSRRRDEFLDTRLDTIVVDVDQQTVQLLYRAFTPLHHDIHEVQTLEVQPLSRLPSGVSPTAMPAVPSGSGSWARAAASERTHG